MIEHRGKTIDKSFLSINAVTAIITMWKFGQLIEISYLSVISSHYQPVLRSDYFVVRIVSASCEIFLFKWLSFIRHSFYLDFNGNPLIKFNKFENRINYISLYLKNYFRSAVVIPKEFKANCLLYLWGNLKWTRNPQASVTKSNLKRFEYVPFAHNEKKRVEKINSCLLEISHVHGFPFGEFVF